MKTIKILALVLAVLLMALALAEQSADELGMELEIDGAEQESAIEIGEEIIGAEGDTSLDLALGDLVSEGPEIPATVAYRFIVNGEDYAVQMAVEGEQIVRPADPEAAEGMTFAGWVLEDGAALFTDADGDGEIDPVIAHVDPQRPEIIVAAKFVEKEDQPADDADTDDTRSGGVNAATADGETDTPPQPADDDGGVDAAATEETEPAADPTPADEQPQPANDDGGVDAAATEETEPTADPTPADEQPQPANDDGGVDAAATGETEPADDPTPADQPAETLPVPNALTYTGDAQALVSAEGAWLYSLDGESYSADLPAAVNAGEYTVFFKAAEDAEAQNLTVTIAKADVVFTPPTAATGEE